MTAVMPAGAQTAGGGGIAMGTMPASGSVGAIVAENGLVEAMTEGGTDGNGVLTLTNKGTKSDRLIALSSPSSREVELRETDAENAPAHAIEGGVDLRAGEAVVLRPGEKRQLVFKGVSRPFAAGSQVALTLTFETAGKLPLTLPVLERSTTNRP